jgi:hypothetical protein
MEHFYLNSCLYRETRIGFSVLERAFAGSQERFAEKNGRAVVVMRKVKKAVMGNGTDGIRITLKKDLSRDLSNSMTALRKKGAELLDIMEDPKTLEAHTENILEFLCVVRSKKQGQRNYFADTKGEASEICQLLDRIYENYVFLFGCIVKMKVQNRYGDSRTLTAIKSKLGEIIEKEERVHAYLASYYAPGKEL